MFVMQDVCNGKWLENMKLFLITCFLGGGGGGGDGSKLWRRAETTFTWIKR